MVYYVLPKLTKLRSDCLQYELRKMLICIRQGSINLKTPGKGSITAWSKGGKMENGMLTCHHIIHNSHGLLENKATVVVKWFP